MPSFLVYYLSQRDSNISVFKNKNKNKNKKDCHVDSLLEVIQKII